MKVFSGKVVMLNFECQRCGECCKRYYIISLPDEVQTQADFLKISKEEFIQEHMQLFLQFFPSEYNEHKIMVSSSMVPKRILEKLEGHLGHVPDFFICLPMLVFKRKEDGACTFFDKNNSGCTIYSVRPAECRMFPFISDKKTENYAKLYSFCEGLKHSSPDRSYVDMSKIHFDEVARYFGKIQENGFSSIWATWPKEGVCLFTDKLVGSITENEFFETIGPFR